MIAAAAQAEAPKPAKVGAETLMAVSVVMPALEMAQETGKLVSWKKKEGEQVKKGEMLLEVETDKAVVEIEAAGDGVLGGVTAKVGDVVPVGQTIAWLLKPGESVPASAAAPAQTGRKMDAAPAAAAAAAAGRRAAARVRRRRAHLAEGRRLAREHGVDIAQGSGSGPGGEILADDILKASASAATAAPPPARRRRAVARRRRRAGVPSADDGCRDLDRPHHGRADDAELDDRAALLRDARRGRHRAQRRARALHPGDRAVARREGHAHRPDRGRRGARAAAASRA